jgi:hypothetical protein
MKFSSRNVMHPYGASSLTTVANEISKYKLDLVRVREVRWDK